MISISQSNDTEEYRSRIQMFDDRKLIEVVILVYLRALWTIF